MPAQTDRMKRTDDATAARAILDRMNGDPHAVMTAEDIEILLRPGQPPQIRKYAALGLFNAQRYAEAVPIAKSIAEAEPTAENLRNLWVILLQVRDLEELAKMGALCEGKVDSIDFHSLMVNTSMLLGSVDEAIRHGDLCLEARDRKFAPAPLAEAQARSWLLPQFNRDDARRNVIAFSLFGNNERYLQGAENNSIVARYVFPAWISRFYVDESVPEKFLRKLSRNGAQVVIIRDMPAERFGTQWRFLVEDDPGVDFYLCRDVDSVMTAKEAAAVGDWLQSDRAFHVMRDNYAHTELVLAGMWGARRGNIGNMRQRILDYDGLQRKIANFIHKDLHFLREHIWPIIRGSVCIHDRMFNFMNPRRFDPRLELPRHRHIGQNDWVHYRRT